MNVSRAVTVGVVAAAMVLPLATPASASSVSPPLAGGFVGPLGLAVGDDGTVYVAEAFGGSLTSISRQGGRTSLVSGRDEVAGVAAAGRGAVVFVGAGTEPGTATLERVLPNGRTAVLAQLGQYEQTANPDQVNTYGFTGLTSECAASLPEELGDGSPYSGVVDAHPYAVATVPGGWVVADAAGNDLVKVGANGSIRTLAVLPGQEVTITPDVLNAFNEALASEGSDAQVPSCVLNKRYFGEPVPTDVELGPDGMLYVTTLPGFPELPGTGSVYRVDPRSGAYTLLGSGFSGATDLAVAPDGSVYVSELFAGRISTLTSGAPTTVAELAFPTAVEWSGGRLYVTQIPEFFDGNPIGQVVVVTP